MASALTGRFVQIAVFSFSFAEVMQFHEISIPPTSELTPIKIGNILNLLNRYLLNGGLPETVLNPEILKNYLTSLFDSILLNDILKRFRIRQTQQLYDLSNYLLSNYTNLYTSSQLKTDLRQNYQPELSLFYYRTRNDKEVDFLLRNGHTIEQLIQVCYDITNSKTLKRETDALAEASAELNCTNLLLLTWDKEEINEKNGLEIPRNLPLIKNGDLIKRHLDCAVIATWLLSLKINTLFMVWILFRHKRMKLRLPHIRFATFAMTGGRS